MYRTLTERYHPIILDPRTMPKPVVAAVNGPAVGIGLSLALSADLIVAAESAYFLLAFVNIGLVPDGGSSRFVPTRMGLARATEMSMLGERIAAAAGTRVGPHQPRLRRRRVRAERRPARRPPGRRADPLLRGHQAPAQRLALRADGGAAGARGDIQQEMAGSATSSRASRVRAEAPGARSGDAEPPRHGARVMTDL